VNAALAQRIDVTFLVSLQVYRGVAIDVKGGDAGVEYSVAVKTLKDGASDSEKCEFLMEAYFMRFGNYLKNVLFQRL